MLSTFATLSVYSAKHLDGWQERPFAAAQGDRGVGSAVMGSEGRYLEAEGIMNRCLKLMLIETDSSRPRQAHAGHHACAFS